MEHLLCRLCAGARAAARGMGSDPLGPDAFANIGELFEPAAEPAEHEVAEEQKDESERIKISVQVLRTRRY